MLLPSKDREIHPVHATVTVGVLVALLTYAFGVSPTFGRPAALVAAAATWLALWLRSRTTRGT